jgi:hypothetical protein
MHPALIATALRDGGHSCVLLKCCSVREALAALSKGNEKTRSQSGTSAREGAEDREIRQLGSECGNLFIEAFDAGAGCSKLWEQ